MKRALIVMAKEPIPGQTKTRLSPPLKQADAAELYHCFVLDTLDLMTRVGGVEPIIAYSPRTAESFFRGIAPPGFSLLPQVGSNLGQRLDHVLTRCLQDGYGQAVVMNSDGPTLPVRHLRRAFQDLDDPEVDVVIGPSDDGGYYLLGLKRPCPELFEVAMSTPRVLQDTLELARRLGLRARSLDTWYDVDNQVDLDRLASELSQSERPVASMTRRFLCRLAASARSGSEDSRPCRRDRLLNEP